MNRDSSFFKKITDFLYDHYLLKQILDILKYLFFSVLSGIIFAFGFSTFITPHNGGNFVIATGGVSGISQIIAKICTIFGIKNENNTIQSLLYTVLNIPLIVFSFFKIGKKFTIFTAINVVVSSIFVKYFSNSGIAESFASVEINGSIVLNSILVRIISAGVFTGVSSALAFVGGASCGGSDIVTYYLGDKKGTQVGKYNVIINVIIFTTYSLICALSSDEISFGYCIYSVLFSCLYALISSLVIDLINLKNKKVRIEIITDKIAMGDILISNFPHGATLETAKGVYTKQDKYIFLMTASSNEYKKIVNLAKRVDPYAFVSIFSVTRLYGNFFSKSAE